MLRFPFTRPKRRLAEAPEPTSPPILRDGVLLGRWYILYRLAEWMKLARRYHRPLSIVVASPVLLPGQPLAEEALESGAAAARLVAKDTDLVGWLEGGRILVIMPETPRIGAASAVFRWRNEINLRTKRKWRFAIIDDVHQYGTADELLQAAAEQLKGSDAP
jgi:hypothetical protein